MSSFAQLIDCKKKFMGLTQILQGMVSGQQYGCLMLDQLKDFAVPFRGNDEDSFDLVVSDYIECHKRYMSYMDTVRELDEFIGHGTIELRKIAEQIHLFEKTLKLSIDHDMLPLDKNIKQNLKELNDISDKIRLMESILKKK
jgi:hypothetical protein